MAEETTNTTELLARKNILLDTCVLIKARENINKFKDVFSLFNKNNCATAIHSFIVNEFLRGSATNSYVREKKEYLKIFKLYQLPITDEIIKDSILISNIYSNKRCKYSYICIFYFI